MERLVEKSQEEANVKIDILEDNKREQESLGLVFGSLPSNNRYDRNSIMVNLQEAVCNRIREQMDVRIQQFLCIVSYNTVCH